MGVFADQAFEQNDFIGFYVGEAITDKEEKQRHDNLNSWTSSSYIFQTNSKYFKIIDAQYFGNKTRFVNHLTEKFANAKVFVIKVRDESMVIFYARKKIEEGEELFFDYGEKYQFDWKDG